MKFINVIHNKNVYADGIHDDTKALQACIDELKDGGTVYFPDGIYLLSGALIFYSYQILKFSDKATLLRSDKSEPLTRYLLASYSEPEWGEYSGTHDVVISGGIFDGNKNLDEKATLINTVHCSNITIENCRFVHCAHWHFIEINGTQNTTVQNCIFDGPSYTAKNEGLYNEQIQLDMSRDGSYGPVYDCDGKLIDFCKDDTVCRNIVIRNNIFKCDGFPGVGHHGDIDHHNILIENNIFDGPSGREGKSRGYIFFRPMVYDLKVRENVFISPEVTDSPSYGIILENPDSSSLTAENNLFIGKIDKEIIIGE
ncbi:MAG: right-handed parallel beta-helix repeat-containing protein [Clostridia bacterium]|nr:right-handed parallel beta-helix repeat-containing protein [Clostridia bacterium]MBR3975879.1 right-handed parallel beta-helix repeat-containing protein [Clostridia bacterium]